MPVLSSLSAGFDTFGQSWTSFVSKFLESLTPYTGSAIAQCIVHVTCAQVAFHSFFWPGFLLWRYIDRNHLLDRYKLHPGKWAPADLNVRVWTGLTTPPPPFMGAARMALAYWMFFYGRQNLTEFSPFKVTIGKLALTYILNDLFDYIRHRALHEVPSWYKLYHKKHHEFKVTNVGATSWNDWEESFGIMVIGNLSAMLARLNLFEYMLWLIMGTFIDAHLHIGYRIPYNPLNVLAPPEWHDFHHYKNLGNYATSLVVWDLVFGTDKHYRKWQARQELAKLQGADADDGPATLEPFEAGFKSDL
ncbi:hypothetical protein M427DRAFT_66764 [Gonapodya prolifera JEL478]|uniref:Fatty acid hydroxylase domain-containing protein n=1 Tax=Gonapodya prolifera (strain JEL478) TaxID=1344416 RepID=A0A139AU21_GONPJ|nr:hypothetical protein M427DRAFT_66764 [Gonapodya prolifera JEL478]|eukprot:KXS20232.1 hypothetical protein M427DRAFT_66764 [Gonapodya prolifera JEL478]